MVNFIVVNRQTREVMDVSENTVRKVVGDENTKNTIDGNLAGMVLDFGSLRISR